MGTERLCKTKEREEDGGSTVAEERTRLAAGERKRGRDGEIR